MYIQQVSMPLYAQIIDFLAGGPSIQEIIKYQPPSESQARVHELLDASKQRNLMVQEEEELDHYIRHRSDDVLDQS